MKETISYIPHENRILIHIPVKFKKRNGKKEIILPEGYQAHDTSDPKSSDSLIIALARAHRWKDLMESGRFTSIVELASALNMDLSLVGRILRLSLLSPTIIEAIIRGDEPSGLSLRTLTAQIPINWEEQKEKFGF